MEKDRRAMKRYNFDLLTFVESETNHNEKFEDNGIIDPDFMGYLIAKNISAGGAFLNTETIFDLNTRVNIELILPLEYKITNTQKLSLTKVKGRVVRVEENGIAVKFDDGYTILSLLQ